MSGKSPTDMGSSYRALTSVPGVVAGYLEKLDATQRITLMSYNLLAQCLVRREMFPYCDKKSLKGSFRRSNLMQELLHYRPDIACLQELDDYDGFYSGAFHKAGYDSVYEKGKKRHGCCIIWRRDRFVRHDYLASQLDQSELAPATTDTRCIGQLLALRLSDPLDLAISLEQLSLKDQQALASGSKPSRKHGIIVTNHHLYWPPNAMYERLRQGWIMREKLAIFKRKHKFPAFMCGDFNSVPTSPLYYVLTGQTLTETHHQELAEIPTSYVISSTHSVATESNNQVAAKVDATEIVDTEEAQQAAYFPYKEMVAALSTLPHCTSAYAQYSQLHPEMASDAYSGEPRFTNYAEWRGTLDYVMQVMDHESHEMRLLQVLRLPDEKMCQPGLPNRVYSSDHLCVMAEYELCTAADNKATAVAQ